MSKDKDKGQLVTLDLWERTRRHPYYRELYNNLKGAISQGDDAVAQKLDLEISKSFGIMYPKDPFEDLQPQEHPLFFPPVALVPKDEKGLGFLTPSSEHEFLAEGTLYDFGKIYLRHGRMLRLEIDIAEKEGLLVESIKQAIKYAKGEKSEVEYPETREHLEKRQGYYKVWDMRQEGLPFLEIAREIFPDDFKDPLQLGEDEPHPNPDSALAKV